MVSAYRACRVAVLAWAGLAVAAAQQETGGMKNAAARLEKELAARYGEAARARAARGLKQVAEFWQPADGDAAAFEEFARRNFAGDRAALDTLFARSEKLFEQVDGHMLEILLALRTQVDLDLGPIEPYDEIFAGYDPSAHVTDDFFKNKLAFVVLLNFPLTTLQERLDNGARWTRRQWAEARLAQRFSRRVPAEVKLAIAEAGSAAAAYIAEYNIWMHHVSGPWRRAPVSTQNAPALALEPA